VRTVVLNFGRISLVGTAAVRPVAETIVDARRRGVAVLAVLPPFERTRGELDRLVRAVSAAPKPRELDMLLSSGALIANALCALAVHALGHSAVSLEGADAGILTDDAHTRARIVEVRPQRIEAELQLHGIVMISGLLGVARSTGDLTTLGPGGADVAAVALAAGLSASRCDIVTRRAGAAQLRLPARATEWARERGVEIRLRPLAATGRPAAA
jgi:aspartate kinase